MALASVKEAGGLVLQTRCYASERSLFLQPLVDAFAGALTVARLRELAGPRASALAGLVPELADLLGPADTERSSSEVERRRIFEAVTLVLRGSAAHRTTLLLLDDLHNAGLATVELLHYLARHAGGARLLVVATVRPEEGQHALDALAEVADRIDVGPLPADAVARLADDAGQPGMAATILRRTRGHTLFVVETLRGLAAGEAGMPESLQAAVLARLRRIGAPAEELLRAGAVLGATVDPAVVAAMLDLAPHVAAQRCAEAAAARLLLLAGPAYEFANDLVQEVLYATTPAPTRVAHHLRAADLLVDTPEAVAGHAVAAQDWTRAARGFLLAGERAMQRLATSDAEALLGRALHAAEQVGDAELIARAYLTRGQAREALGSFRGALGDQQAAAGDRPAGRGSQAGDAGAASARRSHGHLRRRVAGGVHQPAPAGSADRRVARRPGCGGRAAGLVDRDVDQPAAVRRRRSSSAAAPCAPRGCPGRIGHWPRRWTG